MAITTNAPMEICRILFLRAASFRGMSMASALSTTQLPGQPFAPINSLDEVTYVTLEPLGCPFLGRPCSDMAFQTRRHPGLYNIEDALAPRRRTDRYLKKGLSELIRRKT